MSTIRSLITGKLPIGSTTIASPLPAFLAASEMRVLQASAVLPLMRTPQEPQMAARQEQRMPIERVLVVLRVEDAVEHRALGVDVHVVVAVLGDVAGLGVEAADLEGVVSH